MGNRPNSLELPENQWKRNTTIYINQLVENQHVKMFYGYLINYLSINY
jgi:hypothetical protein